ncbi:carbohydrate ABC transporter permease [Desulfosporosinus orientis]|uniref:carbohydrate ABC transporter permease n=1 Tax=Desulfosporosinus orientis TaxID=1563 RepID=UPI0005AA71B4|nr:sugar ABC transporter permease [Desulfosporosinus orientis]
MTALLFALPALIPLFVFWVWPMVYSLYLSFTDWDFISPKYNYVGLANYSNLLNSREFADVLWNTLYFTVGSVVPTLIGGLALALLLNRKLKGIGLYRTILFSPWVTPTVAVSIVWSWIFEPGVGLANFLLSLAHLPKLQWMQSSTWAMPAILIVTIWKSVGWAMIFYLEALQKVPQELYEAADIEGAGAWTKLRKVTLPLISPTTFFLVIINTVNALQAYDQIQVLTQGGPAGATRTILYMYYQAAFEQFNMGQATAIATVLVLLTVVLSIIQFVLARKWVYYQ